MGELTTIQVRKETRDRLKEYGNIGDSYDTAVINILRRIEELERKEAECGGLPATA